MASCTCHVLVARVTTMGYRWPGQVQLCHLLDSTQEPIQRSAGYEARQVHQRSDLAKYGSDYQKLVD